MPYRSMEQVSQSAVHGTFPYRWQAPFVAASGNLEVSVVTSEKLYKLNLKEAGICKMWKCVISYELLASL